MTALLEALTFRRPQPWSADAACLGLAGPDNDPWLPDDDLPAGERARLTALARAVCASCPVRAECLADALATAEAWSIRGGLTPRERRRLAAQRGFPRPSILGASQHGQRSRYVAGCHCPACTEANARYVSGWRARRSYVTRQAIVAVVNVLERPAGTGRHRAWPGQLAIAWERSA